jgi:hypothetical protein
MIDLTSSSQPTVDDGQGVMLTKMELAAKLKVSLRTVGNWQRDGFLPGVKIANVVRFHWPEVVEHLKANFKIGGRGAALPRWEEGLLK